MQNKYRETLDSVLIHTYNTWKVYSGLTRERVYLSEVIEKAKNWVDEKHKELIYRRYDSNTYKKIPVYYDEIYNYAINKVNNYFTKRLDK